MLNLLSVSRIVIAIMMVSTAALAYGSSERETKKQPTQTQRKLERTHSEARRKISDRLESLRISPKAVDKALAYPGLPKKAFREALNYISRNPRMIVNRRFVALADYSRAIGDPRFYIVNLKTGAVGKFHLSHGKGSDPGRTGVPQRFSNVSGSHATSLGFYLTKRSYHGRYGYSLRLKGLSKSNSRAEGRAIVLHPYYVGPGYEHLYSQYSGRACVNGGCLTEGCLGVPHKVASYIVDHLKEGALIYAFK